MLQSFYTVLYKLSRYVVDPRISNLKRRLLSLNCLAENYKKSYNPRKGQMQRLEETELRKADRTVGVNCHTFSNILSGTP